MSTHKSFEKICPIVIALTLILTILFINAERFGIKKAFSSPEYENRLFDVSNVHTIDIVMDNWDEFLENCKNEEYYSCSVVIDGEAYKNVAIRAKGNTSLTQVESYGNDRYSFKIEFDHYDSSKTYYGLDKLCLNNIIQDKTYMKDYLTYQMMASACVASPLCCYANITVNGEEWGLYLAVEGVEESFLKRNYGNDYGKLYKPDNTDIGGGRGNGEKFDMDEFLGYLESESSDGANNSSGTDRRAALSSRDPMQNNSNTSDRGSDNTAYEQNPDELQGGAPPEAPSGKFLFNPGEGDPPDGNGFIQNNGGAENGNAPRGDRPNVSSGGEISADDVMLKYIDDEPDSYSNIFNNAKTDIGTADKKRLIESLQKLSSGENIDAVVAVQSVIRYFAVHNFVLNFDSYTGSMIHNYYLYEKDGQMQMIPWDYNLAFGGFQSMESATSLVNYPIDSPVSDGNVEDRPMIAWIFADEEYTELYHRYLSELISEFFNSGDFENMINGVYDMISPYVEKDPTKFYTYEEFKTGVSTLKEFCLLRAESIEGQLNGSISSTAGAGQSDELVDAGDLQISDMGEMNNPMGDDMNKSKNDMQINSGITDNNEFLQPPSFAEGSNVPFSSEQSPSNNSDSSENNNEDGTLPPALEGQIKGESPTNGSNGNARGEFPIDINGKAPNTNDSPNEARQKNLSEQSPSFITVLISLAVSASVLVVGIIFAAAFRRRK